MLLRIRSAHLGSEMFKFLEEFASIERYFCAVYDYVEKVGHSKGYQNPIRKLGVMTHFSEIIELKFEKILPFILCILKLFWNYGCLIISVWFPTFF